MVLASPLYLKWRYWWYWRPVGGRGIHKCSTFKLVRQRIGILNCLGDMPKVILFWVSGPRSIKKNELSNGLSVAAVHVQMADVKGGNYSTTWQLLTSNDEGSSPTLSQEESGPVIKKFNHSSFCSRHMQMLLALGLCHQTRRTLKFELSKLRRKARDSRVLSFPCCCRIEELQSSVNVTGWLRDLSLLDSTPFRNLWGNHSANKKYQKKLIHLRPIDWKLLK